MSHIMRCAWCLSDPLYQTYHDTEWGLPIYDNQHLFEFLILEGFQAGLSWLTILKKRETFLKAFDTFNPARIAQYQTPKINALLQNPGIVRNRLKIHATIENAKAYLKLQDKGIEFREFIWQVVDGVPLTNSWRSSQEIPAFTPESTQLSKLLKKNEFRFVGPTICYAFMQAVGLVNDHLVCCYRHSELNTLIKAKT